MQGINAGIETLFWKDCWLNGRAPMLLWPDIYRDTQHHNDIVWELAHLLSEAPFSDDPILGSVIL